MGKYIWGDYFGKEEVVWPMIGFLIGFIIIYTLYWKFVINRNLVLGFEKVKDLVRGCINTGGNVSDLYTAYEWFKSTPGVKIMEVKDV